MDVRLKEAAQDGNIDNLYALIREDPFVLDKVDELPFADTPLHIAAAAGHAEFALEVMRLKPSFARKPNQDGSSPLHLALQNDHNKAVIQLVSVDVDLIRVQGREGITPLHLAAQTENLDLMTRFLSVCPKCIEDVTVRSETAFHVAVKNHKIKSLEALDGWRQKTTVLDCEASKFKEGILNWKDLDGNTVLHAAASTNQAQAVKLLLRTRMDINAKNLEGVTAMGILERQPDTSESRLMLWRAGASSSPSSLRLSRPLDLVPSRLRAKIIYHIKLLSVNPITSSEARNATLVIGALIASAAYQVNSSIAIAIWQRVKDETTADAASMDRQIEILFLQTFVAFFLSVEVIFLWCVPRGATLRILSIPLYFFVISSTVSVDMLFDYLWSSEDPCSIMCDGSPEDSYGFVYALAVSCVAITMWHRRKELGKLIKGLMRKYRELPTSSPVV